MTNDNRAIAREVHTLLTSALPHAGDINLTKAAELASFATETSLRGDDDVKECSERDRAQPRAKICFWMPSGVLSSG